MPANRACERLALLDLDQRVQERVHRRELPMRVALLLLPLRDDKRQWRLASTAIRRPLTVAQVRRLVETALALPPPRPSCSPLPADDAPEGAGLSHGRQAALEALRAEADRHISFGELAALASLECCACGLASAPTVCADCPNFAEPSTGTVSYPATLADQVDWIRTRPRLPPRADGACG